MKHHDPQADVFQSNPLASNRPRWPERQIRTTASACSRRAAASIEYIVVLVLIIGVVVSLVPIWGSSQNRIASRVVSAVQGNAVGGTVNVQPPQPGPVTATSGPLAFSLIDILRLLALVAVCVFVYLQQRERRILRSKVQALNPMLANLDAEIVERMLQKRQAIQSILSNEWSTILRADIKVGDLMSHDLIWTEPTQSIGKVRRRMKEQSVHHMLVIDKRRKLLGIVSDRDLIDNVDAPVEEVMTSNPVSVASEVDISVAISMMLRHRINSLPVVAGEQAIGIITTTDLIATLQCMLKLFCEISLSAKSELGAKFLTQAGQDNRSWREVLSSGELSMAASQSR